jgi:predicted Zn-dependent protease
MTEAPGVAADLLDGLNPEETAAARQAFDLLCAELGLSLGTAFDALRSGNSLAVALGLPDGTAALLYDRAYRLTVAGRSEKAAPLFRVLCLIAPNDPKHWLGFGMAEFRENRIDTARNAFAAAIRLAPGWAVARYHAADLAVRSEQWDEAETHLQAFDAAAKADVPNRMFQEVDRLKLATSLARSRRAKSGTTG